MKNMLGIYWSCCAYHKR